MNMKEYGLFIIPSNLHNILMDVLHTLRKGSIL